MLRAQSWCQGPELNRRPRAFQAHALPTELPWHKRAPRIGDALDEKLATLKGLEPSTSAVTGRRSNQLSYSATITRFRLPLYAAPSLIPCDAKFGHGWARTSDPSRVKRVLSH